MQSLASVMLIDPITTAEPVEERLLIMRVEESPYTAARSYMNPMSFKQRELTC
jgi:hypothetical protein